MTADSVSPKSAEELIAYIRSVVDRPHDYNTSADAMWQVAEAAFNYAAGKVGASGFQGEYAALHLYGRLVGIDGPYAVIRGSDLLYPQYDIRAKVDGLIERWTREYAAAEAQKRLADAPYYTADSVRRRWEELAAIEPAAVG